MVGERCYDGEHSNFLYFLMIYPNDEIIEYYIAIDTIDRNLFVFF
jgi:hypothetical protein